jgi:hypothetical protein
MLRGHLLRVLAGSRLHRTGRFLLRRPRLLAAVLLVLLALQLALLPGGGADVRRCLGFVAHGRAPWR